MSVSLKEVLENEGYDVNNIEDAQWIISKKDEFLDLVDKAELTVELGEDE